MSRRALLLAGLFSLFAAPLVAQGNAEAEVRAVVDQLFDGMRAADSAAVRMTMHPEARLVSTMVRDGVPLMQVGSIEGFINAVGTPHEQVWDERISEVEIRVDDAAATAWMKYSFYAGDQFSHCGINAFQLFRTPEGWRIVQIMDTRRPSCSP